jgi:O-antigen ligase
MAVDLTVRRSPRLGPGIGVLVAGVLTGLLAGVLATAVSLPLVALVLIAIAIALPTLLVRDFTLYWLSGYLLFLPFEISKRISNLNADPEAFVNSFGLPPSSYLGVVVFPTDLVLIPLLFAFVVAIQRGHASFHFPRVALLLVAFILWMVLASLLKAQYPAVALPQLVNQCKFVIVFLLFVSVLASPERQRFVTGLLLLALALQVVVALGLYAGGHTRDSLAEQLNLGVKHQYGFLREDVQGMRDSGDVVDFRAAGTFGASSHLAMYLLLLIPLPLALAVTSERLRTRVTCLILFLLAAASLYLTHSRAGSLGLAVGTITCGFLLALRGHVGQRAFLSAAYVALVVVLIQVPVFYRHFMARPETFNHRFTLFQEGIELIVANPVFGVGPNLSTAARVQGVASKRDENSAGGSQPVFDNLYPIHNQYIVVAAETGLVGFAFGAAFFIVVSVQALRVAGSRCAFRSAWGIASISSYAALGTQLMGDHFVGNAQHTLLALHAAMVVALARLERGRSPLPHV